MGWALRLSMVVGKLVASPIFWGVLSLSATALSLIGRLRTALRVFAKTLI